MYIYPHKAIVGIVLVSALACTDDGQSGDGFSACVEGHICPITQVCVAGFCVPAGAESLSDTGDGDPGDGDPGDGDPGDGDPGDGDPGDGDPGDGDPCAGSTVQLFNQPDSLDMPFGPHGGYDGDNSARPADDFTIPVEDQCWCIQRIVVKGTLDGATLLAPVDFKIYDGDDLPNQPVFSLNAVPGGSSDFDLQLFGDEGLLGAGHYWLGVSPLVADLSTGAWYWQEAVAGSGSAWAYETDVVSNPCANQGWVPGSACLGSDPIGLAFELHGVVGGDACP